MSLLPRVEPPFWQKQWRVILLGATTVLFIVFLFVLAAQAHARAGALERLAHIQAARNALALYFYYRNDYPPAGDVSGERSLGAGNAVCLDRSDEGLHASCDSAAIADMLPRGVAYSKAGAGDYLLTFTLERSVGELVNADRSGIIDCEASKGGVRCR